MPNPQDALPLPPHDDLDRYRARAVDLLDAAHQRGEDVLRGWAAEWVDDLARRTGWSDEREITRVGRAVADLAQASLSMRAGPSPVLGDAELVIARAHGFDTWDALVHHLEGIVQRDSAVAAFESAAEAVVNGDLAALRHLLAARPELSGARSIRTHQATLLVYCAANGVENYRQRTPPNIVAIARTLLGAGADVEAAANVYGGGWATLGLAATSQHPRLAGVQSALIDALLESGARIDRASRHGIVIDCMANGCPEAAAHLAARGARLDVAAAAAVGRLDIVQSFVSPSGERAAGVTPSDLVEAFRWACAADRLDVITYVLDGGFDMHAQPPDEMTGLHWAVIGAHLATIDLLLARRAPLEHRNEYGGTPLGQALWSAAHGGDAARYLTIVRKLLAAGAIAPQSHPPIDAAIDAVLTESGSVADPDHWWAGEEPRRP